MKNWQEKEAKAWVLISEDTKESLNSLLSPEFPICNDKDILLPPEAGRVPFMWEIYFLFLGGQRRVRVPFLYWLLNNFNSKNQYAQVRHFGVACLEPHHQHSP